MTSFIVCCIACLLLYVGAQRLLSSIEELARRSELSPYFLSMAILALGTSLPELITSLQGSLGGHIELASANLVGSNICNTLLLGGLLALGLPKEGLTLVATQRERREMELDLLWTLAATLVLLALSIVFGAALFLVSGFIFGGFIAIFHQKARATTPLVTNSLVTNSLVKPVEPSAKPLVSSTRSSTPSPSSTPSLDPLLEEKTSKAALTLPLEMLSIVLSLAALLGGGYLLVEGGLGLARLFHWSERFAGAGIVALGTSAPEVASTLAALSWMRSAKTSIDKKSDATLMLLGNLLGSNLMNLLAILPLAHCAHLLKLLILSPSDQELSWEVPSLLDHLLSPARAQGALPLDLWDLAALSGSLILLFLLMKGLFGAKEPRQKSHQSGRLTSRGRAMSSIYGLLSICLYLLYLLRSSGY